MDNNTVFFNWLVQNYQNGTIDVVLTMNGIDYDKDFKYNEQKDVLTANSTSFPNQEFGSDCKTITHHINNKNVKITIRFNK